MTLPCCGCSFNGGPPPNGDGSPNIGFWADRIANQTISSGLDTPVDWLAKRDEAPVGIMNLATDLFTVPNRGRYIITAGVEMTLSARGACFLRIYKNAVYMGGSSDETSIAGTVTPNLSQKDWYEVGDTIQITVFQNSGFSASLVGCCNQLWFSAAAIYAE